MDNAGAAAASAALTTLRLLLIAACAAALVANPRNRTAERLELKFFGRALSYDWHFRSHRVPPMRETILIQQTTTSSGREPTGAASTPSPTATTVMEFFAFRKIWTLRLAENTMLLSAASSFEQRTAAGTLLLKESGPRGCFLIGTAEADEHEYGHAAVTTCNGKLHGLVITNINDYVIFSNDWRSPLFPQPLRRQSRASGHPQRHRRHTMRNGLDFEGTIAVANLTEYESPAKSLPDKLKLPIARRLRRRRRRSTTVTNSRAEIGREPLLGPLLPPHGRAVHVELGIIMDKWYINDFREQVSPEPADLVIHAAELINNAQLWYIHHTLGFQVWLTLRNAVMVNDDAGLKLDNFTHSYPASMCKWVTETFPEEMSWDEVIMFSSKEGIWHGRSGLAQRSGVCAADGKDRCAGVSHLNFQMASLARLVAHEAMHPLGVSDDYDGLTSEMCFSGMMRRGVWQDHDWSPCSVHDLERWLEMSSSKCVARRSTPSLTDVALPPLLPLNVAWRAKASQSSTFNGDDDKWGAWKATDGGLSGVPPNGKEEFGSCTHTKEEDFPWLRIELDVEYRRNPIHKIILYNRDDCCSERLHGIEVRVGNFSEFSYNPVCASYDKVVPGGRYGALVLECMKPMTGRFVSVHLRGRRQILSLCELQVLQMVRAREFDNRMYHHCQDHHGFCPFWAAIGECRSASQRSFMDKTCPYSCGACKRPSRMHPPPVSAVGGGHVLASLTSTTLPTTPASTCRDKYDSCMHSAANGDCFDSFEMEQKCPRSCGFCRDTDDVPDGDRASQMVQTVVEIAPQPVAVAAADESSKQANPKHGFVAVAASSQTATTATIRHRSDARTAVPGAAVVIAAAAAESVKRQDCRDHSTSCPGWQRAGYCKTSSHARRLCEAACQLCGGAESDNEAARLGGDAWTSQVTAATRQLATTALPRLSTPLLTMASLQSVVGNNWLDEVPHGGHRSTRPAAVQTAWQRAERVSSGGGGGASAAPTAARIVDSVDLLPRQDAQQKPQQQPTTTVVSSSRLRPFVGQSGGSSSSSPSSFWTTQSSATAAATAADVRRRTTPWTRCADLSHACGAWKKQGYCVRSQSVQKACRETCGLC